MIPLRQSLGQYLAAAGAADEARSVVAKYLAEQPGVAQSHAAAGWTYWFLGEPDTAAMHLETAIRLDPSFPWQYEGLGMVRYDQGRWPEALDLLTEAARNDSAMRRGGIALRDMQRRMGEFPAGDFPKSDSRLL